MESRRPDAFSRGVIRPQGAVSKTNLFNVQNWLQRERRSKDTRPLSKPSLCPNRAKLIHFQSSQGHTWPRAELPRSVTPTLDRALLAGPPKGSHLHGPMKKRKAGHAVCFTPGQGLSPRAAPLASLGEREGLPIHQAPFVSSSSSNSTLPPPMDSCCPLQVPRV